MAEVSQFQSGRSQTYPPGFDNEPPRPLWPMLLLEECLKERPGANVTTQRQKVFYRIGRAAGIVLVVAWWWWCLLEMSYVGWSKSPQPEIGRTVPHQVKNIVVYISPKDAEFGRHLTWTMIVSGSLLAICLVFSGELNKMINPPKPPLPPLLP
jgi:hypothetical protein